jgi:hypothetical protein
MIEGEDFELTDIRQLRKQRGSHVVNSYMLTPESFKSCLARSRRYTGQPVDPVIYFRYFLLLEKMVKLYFHGTRCHTRAEKKVDSFNSRERQTAKPRAKHY